MCCYDLFHRKLSWQLDILFLLLEFCQHLSSTCCSVFIENQSTSLAVLLFFLFSTCWLFFFFLSYFLFTPFMVCAAFLVKTAKLLYRNLSLKISEELKQMRMWVVNMISIMLAGLGFRQSVLWLHEGIFWENGFHICKLNGFCAFLYAAVGFFACLYMPVIVSLTVWVSDKLDLWCGFVSVTIW